MMIFSQKDLEQIQARTIPLEKVLVQLETFRQGYKYSKLIRPCILNDGIVNLEPENFPELLAFYADAANSGRLTKFVPASGAATRMFRNLMAVYSSSEDITRMKIEARAEAGDKDAKSTLQFFSNLHSFAFYADLKNVMLEDQLDLEDVLHNGDYKILLKYILTPSGLNYASLPKGLMRFHKYRDGSRSAVEEHLIEALAYCLNGDGQANIHFTVSPEHLDEFRKFCFSVSPKYEIDGAKLNITFSTQKISTETIAVNPDNTPFRMDSGELLFRPAGHGALLENLNELKADIIFIKNIDNVVPDHLKEETIKYKKLLCGYLVKLQKKIFEYLSILNHNTAESKVGEMAKFAGEELFINLPVNFRDMNLELKINFLTAKLNRPLRICGVVKQTGEPGGGPFWVQDEDGSVSLQIVESSQVNFQFPEQKRIWSSSAYFNSVDIIAGLRDYQGQQFNLLEYINPDTAFITQKSQDGRALKALELPGLWNGSMAYWNTIFIETPPITFCPVKTVNDLLRKEHLNH